MFTQNKKRILAGMTAFFVSFPSFAAITLPNLPLGTSLAESPLTMITMGKDHRLFYEAYNDASDIDDDDIIDTKFKPTTIYYGLFDSDLCYTSSGDTNTDKFSPSAVATLPNRTCSGGTEWSGNFLNYMTTSRIDAIRKIFYGGLRDEDTTTSTVLRRAYIPQDAHSWGKEYHSIAVDGYDIQNYTPLSLPATNTRHIFANVTLVNETNPPSLRILQNSGFRVWNWLSRERPVAGSLCIGPCVVSGGDWPENPTDETSMNDLFTMFKSADHLVATTTNLDTVDGTTTPGGVPDEFISELVGTFKTFDNATEAVTWEFSVDGDDAIDAYIEGVSPTVLPKTRIAHFYAPSNATGHGMSSSSSGGSGQTSGSVVLTKDSSYKITVRQHDSGSGQGWKLYSKKPSGSFVVVPTYKPSGSSKKSGFVDNSVTQTFWNTTMPGSTMSNKTVRVEVCTAAFHGGCKQYPNGQYKPTGLLHDYGENNTMLFGLLTGSYENNTEGGRLRKNISSFSNEIEQNTGIVKSTGSTCGMTGSESCAPGIISNINAIKISGFTYGVDPSPSNWNHVSGWITNRQMNDGEAPNWGNPLGEMMYETIRYLSGMTATATYSSRGTVRDDAVGLSKPTWLDPYAGKAWCTKSNIIAISDISPSFDANAIPGSSFLTGVSNTYAGFDPITLGATIATNEAGVIGSHYIGESGATSDNAPTAKNVTSLANIRGLAPEDPTRKGSFYTSILSYFAKISDIRSDKTDVQTVDSYMVGLSSPLPKITIPTASGNVTIIPFAKSLEGANAKTDFRPTNQIVDFYIDSIDNQVEGTNMAINGGRYSAKFRINYEDVEQAADHDMDAIALYEIWKDAAGAVQVRVSFEYQAGGAKQSMGYVISGTNRDGVYLVIQDENSNTPYYLNVPPGRSAGYCDDATNILTAECKLLPASTGAVSTQSFTPSSSGAATLLENPLWFAAKWGGFTDKNANNKPDLPSEWDADNDGVPDNYFFVQNPTKLKASLKKSLDAIVMKSSAAGNITSNSTTITTDTQVFQAIFSTSNWSGDLIAYPVTNATGVGTVGNWKASDHVPTAASRKVYSESLDFKFSSWNAANKTAMIASLGVADNTELENLVNYTRGDRSKEIGNGGSYRNRNSLSVLGDIVHSSPFYVKDTNTVFIGGNDGMLHAINGTTGAETFAYIPTVMLPKLKPYSSPTYSHTWGVDGDIAVSSLAQTPGHNYLISSYGHGNKGMFALDVSNPSTFDSSDYLWKDETSNEIGYVLGKPIIAKMNDGNTYVIIGNGYNSINDKASLLIYNLATGARVKTLQPSNALNTSANGLATPGVFDADNDGMIDYIYAGDLKGNVWKFDVSSTNKALWDVANSGAPFFIATDSSSNIQPITAQMYIAKNTDSTDANLGKTFVFFGSGSYFRASDPMDTQVQSWYGVIDEGAVVPKSDLIHRTIVQEATVSGKAARVYPTLTAGDMIGKKGWYLDFDTTSKERIVTSSKIFPFAQPTLVGSSIIPNSGAGVCVPGGTGYLNAIKPWTGTTLTVDIFDVTGDKLFNNSDKLSGQVIGGVDIGVGMPSEPVLIGNRLVVGGSTGEVKDIVVNLGVSALKSRISWREIKMNSVAY